MSEDRIVRPVEWMHGVEGIAKAMHKRTSTVRRLIKDGLPVVYIDGAILADKAEVHEWLKKHRRTS